MRGILVTLAAKPRREVAVPTSPSRVIQALRLVAPANRLFERLRRAGVDKSGNREFLYSHYAALVLLGFFNPALQSLRGLQQAPTLAAVQRRLGLGRVSLGSLSESVRVFDPALLVPLVAELLAEHGDRPGPGPRRTIPEAIPDALARRLVAVDGTALQALPRIACHGSQWKLHLHFRPLAGLPGPAVVADGLDERDALERTVEPGCVYLADRGYERYALLNRIAAAGSDYVFRAKDRPFAVRRSRPVDDAGRAARVVSDDLVALSPTPNATRAEPPTHAVRRIVLAARPPGRVRRDRPAAEAVVLITSLTDVPADVVAAVYELRWSIELFFRFLKQMLGSHKLFSTRDAAAEIQIYCALIACLLLARVTGGRVTKDVWRMVMFYLQGLADDGELDAAIAKARQQQQSSRTG
jgi:hypothetical protein